MAEVTKLAGRRSVVREMFNRVYKSPNFFVGESVYVKFMKATYI